MVGLIASAAMVALASPGMETPADAQVAEIDASNEVLSRARPGLDPVGFQLGGFRLFPQLNAAAGHDDNVYDSNIRRAKSTIYTVEPRLAVNSVWSRHALNLTAIGSIERFSNTTSENKEQYMLMGAGRVDLGRRARIDLNGQIARAVEARGTAGDILTAGDPIRFHTRGGGARLVLTGNRLSGQVGAGVSRFVYRDVRVGSARVSQAYRDRDAVTLDGRVDVRVQPTTSVFVQAIYNRQRYDIDTDAGTLDSDGMMLLGGLSFDLGRLVTGRVAGGYLVRDYDNPALRSARGAAYDVSLVWNPRTLVSVTLIGRRTIGEAPTPRSSGFISDAGTVMVDYEVTRRLIAQARASYTVEKYRGLDRTDRRTEGRVALRYLMNRSVELGLQYDHRRQNGSGIEGRSYNGNAARLTVTLQR